MKKTILASLATIALLALPSLAHADAYARAEVGTVVDDSAFNADTTAVGGAFGIDTGHVRYEAGATKYAGDMVYNGAVIIDMPITDLSTLFVGAGADYYELATPDVEGWGWQARVGYGYALSSNVQVEVAATYHEADLDGMDLDYTTATAGLRIRL